MPNQRLRRRQPDAPRRAAYRILRAVTSDGAYANLETARVLGASQFDARDAAFVTEIVFGTCRLLGTYDQIIEAAAGRSTFDAEVRDVLRLGTHQLFLMRVPPHAAISTAVDLGAAEIGEKVAGLVNAILRKVAARDLSAWVDWLADGLAERDELALRTHHPRWIVDAYLDVIGPEAETALHANNLPPIPNLVIRPGLATVEDLDGEPDIYSPFGAHRYGNPADVPAVAQGLAGVQDEGSQLVAWALTRAEAPAGPWLDLCAGPGGKAALLAGLAQQRGHQLVANEVQPHRADLVAQALAVYADEIHPPSVVTADGTDGPWQSSSFARVMADVPCTGLGSLRRRPESRWRRQPTDLADLVPMQRALLHAALDAAAPGGVVAYVTCSPHRAETVDAVAAVLAQRSDVQPMDTAGTLPEVPEADLGDALQLWPHRHGTDAMFLALLRRT